MSSKDDQVVSAIKRTKKSNYEKQKSPHPRLLAHVGRFNDVDAATGLPCNGRFPLRMDSSVCAVLVGTFLIGKLSIAGVAEANRLGLGRTAL